GRVRARLVTGAPRRAHPRPRGAREAGGAPRRNARAPHSAKMIVTERRRRRRIWLQIDDRRVGRSLAIPQNAPIQPTPSVHRRLDYPAALGLDPPLEAGAPDLAWESRGRIAMPPAMASLLSCGAPRCSAGCVMTGTSGPFPIIVICTQAERGRAPSAGTRRNLSVRDERGDLIQAGLDVRLPDTNQQLQVLRQKQEEA